MKKLVLKTTGEPVEIGNLIKKVYNKEYTFGTLHINEIVKVTEHNVNSLIKEGILKYVEEKPVDNEVNENSIEFYINTLAIKYNKSKEDIVKWLNSTNKVCPKAVLDILLNEIATYYYQLDPDSFDNAEQFYSLRPKDGKVGKVINPCKYIPCFKNIEDADKARYILRKQLEFMYGE